jgi:hypothetical protein
MHVNHELGMKGLAMALGGLRKDMSCTDRSVLMEKHVDPTETGIYR